MKNEDSDSNVIVVDQGNSSDCDDTNTLPPHLLNPMDRSYEKPEKLQNRIKLIESIQDKIDDDKLFICLDIEAYERNHDYLTEFGWCLFKKKGEPIKTTHLIVEEYKNYHNGRYVPDNKENYNFGTSEVKKLEDIYNELKNDFEKVNYLVGHGINNDIKFLKQIKVDVSKFKKMNNANKIDDYGIIETMDLYSGFFRAKPVGLEKSLRKLGINYRNLHNAGNDAYYTMKVFLEIINRFDFSSNREYEQIMNYKPPKKMKSNNNKNNKTNGNGSNNNYNSNSENDQGENIHIDKETKYNNTNTMDIVNTNSNVNHQNNGNNKNHNKNNRSNNSNNKDNNGGNRKIVKKGSQRRNNNKNFKNLNNKKSHGYMKSNNINGYNNNNYNINNNHNNTSTNNNNNNNNNNIKI